ncbi:CobW-like GTP-binding protein, partial [Staphylococcus epidermidis]|uniref:CobW-like GTP-binding protein n=1 Tax=Staphylococcus epidermidis TaxID=1282 RepID=UPI0021B290F6
YLKYQPHIIFIQSTPLPQPLPLLHPSFTPLLPPFITLTTILPIIDPSMYSPIKSYPQHIAPLFYQQLPHSSTLFLNKIHNIHLQQTPPLLPQLQRLNTDPNIQVSQFGELNLETVLEPT